MVRPSRIMTITAEIQNRLFNLKSILFNVERLSGVAYHVITRMGLA